MKKMAPLSLELILFLGISSLIVILALFIIFAKDQVRAIIYLAFFFVSVAALYMVLGAQYIAIVQVMVYAGGVVVLFIFAIHLTRAEEFRVRGNIKRNIIIGIPIIGGLFVVLLIGVSEITGIESTSLSEPLADIGMILFGEHMISFIFVGLVLFATTIASIYLISGLIVHEPAKLEEREETMEVID